MTAKKFLLTGGAGSLGRHLISELLRKPKSEVEAIRVLDNHENSLARLKLEIPNSHLRLRFLLGDITDQERMDLAMDGVDVVILMAAAKHVDLCETNPFFSLKTNVIGTQVCINAALKANVDKILFMSSDKSVYACSTYGRCKALSESLILDAMKYKGDRRTKCAIARPPNYLRSDGSVFEIWAYQKEQGLPLSVTDERMERFFMPFADIVKFVLKCIDIMEGGEIFVPIGAQKLKIIDLARQFSPKIEVVGARPGERLTEYLFTEEEMARAKQDDGLWIIPGL